MTHGPGWHPYIVHFPLALIVTAAFTLSIARWLPSERQAATLATVGTWNLCLGAVTVLFALGTGLAAVLDLHAAGPARQATAMHVKAAMMMTVLVGLVSVWHGAGTETSSRPSRVFLVILWVATAALAVTGYRGGQNVFHYGVGVSAPATGGPP